MLSKFELIGIGTSVLFMALALYFVRVETSFLSMAEAPDQAASVAKSGIVVVGNGDNVTSERTEALLDAADSRGNLTKLVIDDILVGTGAEVKNGDEVVVHYIGTLQNGEEFDSSKKRGVPFEFTVGEGRVIRGWEEGLIGMKVGGQRILVVPPEMGYGDAEVGPIPPNSTLVFAIELLEVK